MAERVIPSLLSRNGVGFLETREGGSTKNRLKVGGSGAGSFTVSLVGFTEGTWAAGLVCSKGGSWKVFVDN